MINGISWMNGWKILGLALIFIYHGKILAQERPALPDEGVVSRENQAFMDHELDYHRFTARVTDRDVLSRILKIQSETLNSRFFRAGDRLDFTIDNRSGTCRALVRNVEEQYVTLFVPNIRQCKDFDDYLRRGSKINITSTDFRYRVEEASSFRKSLIIRKEDFLKQLNQINHFLWSYDQIKQELGADYDEKILEIENKKQNDLNELRAKREDQIILQKELQKKLTELDRELDFYRVERQEWLTDRWDLDHDQALPFGQRPQDEKIIPKKGRRWEKTSFK